MLNINSIGIVKSLFKEHVDPLEMQKHISHIIVDEKYKEGLKNLEENCFLQILFQFHLCDDEFELLDGRYKGKSLGIFASRSTRRPNNIGLTTVKLIEINGIVLTVIGLDALDGSPVLDIKPFNHKLDHYIPLPFPITN